MKSNFKYDHSTGVSKYQTNKTIGRLTSNPPEATRSANTSATGNTAPITTNSKAYKADNRLNKLSLQISKLQNKLLSLFSNQQAESTDFLVVDGNGHSGGECLTTDVTTPHCTVYLLFFDQTVFASIKLHS